MKHWNWKYILHNLNWQAHRQSTVLDVFELLVMRGFFNLNSNMPHNSREFIVHDWWYQPYLRAAQSYCPYHDINVVFRTENPLQGLCFDEDQWCHWNLSIYDCYLWSSAICDSGHAGSPRLNSSVTAHFIKEIFEAWGFHAFVNQCFTQRLLWFQCERGSRQSCDGFKIIIRLHICRLLETCQD